MTELIVKFMVAAILAGTPLLFGTVGEIISEKSGHLNLGVEGMMAMGACAGFMAGYISDNFIIAMLAAWLGGVFGAFIYGVLTITFMANQNVTGLTLTIFGVGLSNFIGVYMIGKTDQGTLKLPEAITGQMRGINIPGLSQIPVLGELLFSYSPFVYLGILIALAAGVFLRKTKTGLSIQAIGENPAAADAAGIQVTKLRYLSVLTAGGICGIGGAYCSMIINGGVWISNNVGGLGWIAVALVIFASWKPERAIMGSFIFGGLRVLKYYIPKTTYSIPTAFFDMLPFLMTAGVLVISSMKKNSVNKIPANLGINYYREER